MVQLKALPRAQLAARRSEQLPVMREPERLLVRLLGRFVDGASKRRHNSKPRNKQRNRQPRRSSKVRRKQMLNFSRS